MVNEEILGGLKSAVDRGESLKKAMMTFYNAGYKKEEIEEAARFLNERPVESQVQTPITPVSLNKQNFFEKIFQKKITEQKQVSSEPISIPQAPVQPASKPAQQIVSSYGTPQQVKPVQQISNYEKKEPKDKIMIVILITILVLLLGLLASIFLFKQEIINFFANALS